MPDWTWPAAALGCAAGMHWLRNRLAGAEAAQLVHIMLIVGALLVSLVVLWRQRSRKAGWKSRHRLGLAIAGVVVLLVANDANKGFDLWSKATAFAAATTHCVMTYGGFERQRQARNGWDLSPLVNRRYGTWQLRRRRVVMIAEPAGLSGYRCFTALAPRWSCREVLRPEFGNHAFVTFQPRRVDVDKLAERAEARPPATPPGSALTAAGTKARSKPAWPLPSSAARRARRVEARRIATTSPNAIVSAGTGRLASADTQSRATARSAADR